MKKILTAVMAMVLAGCGGTKDAGNTQSAPSGGPEETADTTAGQGSPVPEAVAEELLQPEVLDVGGGYSATNSKYIHYGALIKNPNETAAMEFVKYTVTLKDQSGKTVGVDDGVVSAILAGEVIAVEGQINCEGSSPERIEMKASCADRNFLADKEMISAAEFYFRDVSVFERNGLSVVGTLLNNSNLHTDTVKIVAFLRDRGKIVYGESKNIDEVDPGENVFQLDIHGSDLPVFDTVELYAQDRGTSSGYKTIASWTPESGPVNENVISYGSGAAAPAPAAVPETAPGSFEEFRKKMDDYEAFFDSYAEFMKSYDPSNTSTMFAYLDMLAKYADAMEALDEIDESALTPEEEAYYTQVMLRITQKLLEVAG